MPISSAEWCFFTRYVKKTTLVDFFFPQSVRKTSAESSRVQQAVFFKLCVLLELPASNFRKYSLSRLEATRKDDWWCASFFSSKPFWQIRQKPFYGKLFSYEVAENYRPCYITNIVLQICHFEVHCSINVRTVNLTILLHKLA